MEVSIIKKTKETLVVEWDDGEKGFGQLVMEWDKKQQRFILDSEMMGIDFVLKVLNEVSKLIS